MSMNRTATGPAVEPRIQALTGETLGELLDLADGLEVSGWQDGDQATIAIADEQGVGKLSMRHLARSLGYEVMSLYNHVRNKDDLLAAERLVVRDERLEKQSGHEGGAAVGTLDAALGGIVGIQMVDESAEIPLVLGEEEIVEPGMGGVEMGR